MARVVWTQKARGDLLRLRDFLAPKSTPAAARAVQTIRGGLQTLKIAPEAGISVPWLPTGYREWYIPFGKSGYVVLYRYLGTEVVIQTIRHGRKAGYPSG
jgi:plasmid stabilization system protein ParE